MLSSPFLMSKQTLFSCSFQITFQKMIPEEDLEKPTLNGHSNLNKNDHSEKSDSDSERLNLSTKDIETLVEQISKPISEYLKLKSEEQDRTNERSSKENFERLKLIGKLDTGDKIFKGSMLLVCITALLLVVTFIEDSEGIIPVLSLTIGLLFKNSSLSAFLSFHKDKNTDEKQT